MDFFQQEELEPTSCGYFNKVMQAVVTKSKAKVLTYLLLHRKGDIFNLLLDNLQHHSLGQLMVELMQIKITGSQTGSERNRASSDYDNKTDDEEDKPVTPQEHLNTTEQAMSDVLN